MAWVINYYNFFAIIGTFFISRDLKKSICPHADQLLPKLPAPHIYVMSSRHALDNITACDIAGYLHNKNVGSNHSSNCHI